MLPEQLNLTSFSRLLEIVQLWFIWRFQPGGCGPVGTVGRLPPMNVP